MQNLSVPHVVEHNRGKESILCAVKKVTPFRIFVFDHFKLQFWLTHRTGTVVKMLVALNSILIAR